MQCDLDEQVVALEFNIQKVTEMAIRIGKESKRHTVYIDDLKAQCAAQSGMMGTTAASLKQFQQHVREQDAIVLKAIDRMTETLDETQEALAHIKIDRAKDEAKISRQAIYVWLATVVAVISVAWSAISGSIIDKLHGG